MTYKLYTQNLKTQIFAEDHNGILECLKIKKKKTRT